MGSEWLGAGEGLAREVLAQSRRCLDTYRTDPLRVEQDANIESSVAQGGYGRKQIHELLQNGADALLGSSGRLHALLTTECLYVANEGSPMSEHGVRAIMASHVGLKRGEEIGRFGLGFKSVVAISDRPQVISRTGSFAFDRERSLAAINEVVRSPHSFPIMRLAEPIDPFRLAEEDDILAELMEWATTVMRIPLSRGYDGLSEDIREFPAEFLLFSPQASELILEDRTARIRREVRVASPDLSGTLMLDDDGEITAWRVASTRHRPSRQALDDAGNLARRDVVAVSWAIPIEGRAKSALGRFWAFFPTQDQTTLSGIVNAPWKLSDDRRNLLEGTFNREILADVLPRLVADEWKHLLDSGDPAAVLDLLPARGREPRSWADSALNEPVFRHLARSHSLPDVDGVLRKPVDLKLHPRGLSDDLLSSWSSLKPAPAGWVHHGVDRTPERRLKAERLIGDSEASRPSVTTWVEALLSADPVAASAAAIGVVDSLVRVGGDSAKEARAAKVVLLEDGSHAPAVPGRVFVRSSPEDEGFQFIDADLAKLPRVIACLDRLGIQVLDRAGELRNLLSGRRPEAVDWGKAWALARQCTSSVAIDVLRDELPLPLESSVMVRTRAGRFATLGMAFLPGGVVSATGQDDAAFSIDTVYHRADLELLNEVGAVSQPVLRYGAPEEVWLRAYKDLIIESFVAESKGQKPQIDRLEAVGAAVPWPLEPLASMSSRAQVAMTTVALSQTSGEAWTVRHQTVSGYGEKKFINPVYWRLTKYGRLMTSFGPMHPGDCLVPSDEHPEDVLPVADMSPSAAEKLGLKKEPSELRPEVWRYLLDRVVALEDPRRTFRLYAWACYFVGPPDRMIAQVGPRVGLRRPEEVAVVSQDESFRSLVEQQIPAVLVDEEADFERLQDAWGLEDGNKQLEQELVYQPSGEVESLVFRFPKMKLWLSPDLHDVGFQYCDEINLVTATRAGQKTRPVPHAMEDNRLLVTSTEPSRILRAASEALHLGLTPADIHSIIEQIREEAIEKLIADVRNADSDAERLALLVGEEGLRRSLPQTALEGIEEQTGKPLAAVEMAELGRAVHGVGVLQHFRAVLEDKGLNPPRQWAGRTSARRWVTDLGFAPELAGFVTQTRPAMFLVDGPVDLAPLHDFQETCTANIKSLLRGDLPSRRGMVSLPTGAGKTRVAVQALVDEIAAGRLFGPIVWIAQTDELCEQAVDTWSYIWRAVGPRDVMSIGRLWGGNDFDEFTEGFQLVVATPDTLTQKVGSTAYQWITEASVVVVDEAHTSVAPSYTKVLEWLGRRARTRKDDRPLIGLTATPFRNTSKDETERLAIRYDKNRLDEGAFVSEPYPELQARGVLAQVQQEVLKGIDVSFTADEITEVNNLGRVPRSVENRLGGNLVRNQRIVESVAALPKDWTTLLFATSVENARVLAAQLTHAGVPAVAISSDTDQSARRWYIDEFRAGRIRVITNYGVLAQGFDAPAVKAVYVTRPTFSANVYQQMIGRGLRGPRNGGSEEVLIVNVEDNFQQFGDRLAFTDFEYLWKPDA